MNTKGHIISDEQLQEYKELKNIVENKKTFRITYYNIMNSISCTEKMRKFYVPHPGKDYLAIDILNTNDASQKVINLLEKWFCQYEENHKKIIEEIDKKIKYLQENDKDLHIPTKMIKYENHNKKIETTPHNEFKWSFLDYLKGLVKFKW